MSVSSIYSNPVNSTLTTVPAVPSSPDDSSGMPFNQVLNDTLSKYNLGQSQSSTQSTASLAKPTLSVLNFLQNSFFGKTIPVTDDQRQIVETGKVVSISKVDSHYEALLQDPRTRESFQAKLVFEKQPLGQSYKIQNNAQASLKVRADMQQRLDAAVNPLVDEETASVYNPLTLPDIEDPNKAGDGESLEFYNPKTDKMETGALIIMRGRPYLRDEGVPLSLRAEKL